MKAIFTHNNAYDSIILENGTVAIVDTNLFMEFADISSEKDFENWDGTEYWDGMQAESITIEEAANAYGETVAYYKDNKNLIVTNAERWNERTEFYIGS